MATVFTRIIDGELPGRFVWKDDLCVAFLSINPIQSGHLLVVPRAEVDHWIDLEPELLDHVMKVSHTISRVLMEIFEPSKVGLMLAGLEVPHAHIHLLPIWDLRDLSFANADPNPDPAALDAVAEKIRTGLRNAGVSGVSD
jgi:histidine triad (HIT) family protein